MKYSFGFIMLFLFLFSCEETGNLPDCQDVEVCTEEFRYISVKINVGSNSVFPDSIHTRNTKNDSSYIFENDFMSETNHLVVITDAQLNQLNQNGTLLFFEGFNQNTKIFSEPFVVGHDCCHIVKLQGKNELNL